MRIASIFKKISDGLWAVGGIGAAAELGLEDFGARHFQPCPASAPAVPASLGGVRFGAYAAKAAGEGGAIAQMCETAGLQ